MLKCWRRVTAGNEKKGGKKTKELAQVSQKDRIFKKGG